MRSRDRADASRDCRSIMIGDPAPLRARSGRNPGRGAGGRVRRPETPKLVARPRSAETTKPLDRRLQLVDTAPRRVPGVREARSRLRLYYLARLSKMYLSVRPGPVSVTAEVLRPDASRARSGPIDPGIKNTVHLRP